jgi:hypothetical protein
MTTRNLNFDDNGLSFLLLNIIGHDPIHDFGQPSDNRWHQVNKQINDIQPFILSNDDSYGKRQRDDDNDNNAVNNEVIENAVVKNEGNKKRRRIKGGAALDSFNFGFKYQPKPLLGVSTLKQNMTKPPFQAEVSRPEVSRPEVSRPKVSRPEVSRPEVSRPEVSRPEVSRPEVSRPEVSRPEVSRPEVSRPKVYEGDSFPDVNALLNIITYVNDNNQYDSHLINEYFDDIKNKITMNLFINNLNRKKYLLNHTAEYGSLRSICNSIIIPDVIQENEMIVFITLSRHLHDYIVSRFLSKIDEKQVLGIAFDAIMTEHSTIRIRYIKLDKFTLGNNKDTNTELINKNKNQYTVEFMVTEIMDTFFNSNYYFLHSLQKTFLVKEENNKFAGGNEFRDGDTNNLDIEIVRGILNFKEGVFKDIPIITNGITEQIQKIRNAIYSYVMAAKGYEYNNNNNKITLLDINNAFQKKKSTDEDDNEKFSTSMNSQKGLIIKLFIKSFDILKYDKTFVSNFKAIPTRFSTSRSMLRIDDEIDKELSLLFRDEINFRKKFDDKIRKDKIEDDKRELALSAGSLTPSNKETANNFISFIAKSALYLTNCCDSSGSITRIDNTKKNDTNYNILIEEIECIRNIAGIDGFNNYWSPTKGSKDIDKQLFSYIKEPSRGFINTDKQLFNENDLVVNKGSNKYVINNAASIHTLQRNTFCPYTSILDGMSLCSWGSESTVDDNIERGDMDFKITSKNQNSNYYNGVLNILSENTINVGFHIKLDKIQISSIEGLDMNARALVAHVVLRNTLNSILSYINDPSFSRERSELYAEKNIFIKLFQIGVGELQIKNNSAKNKSSHPGSIFTSLLKNLLFKGVGDIFQEINAICAFGGYDGNKYKFGNNVIGYKVIGSKDKNTPRCFVAKDRVSVCRYLFIRKQGDTNEINTTTSGGYIDGVDNKSNTGISYTTPQRGGGGGGTNPHTIINNKNVTLKKKNRIVLNDGKFIININLHKTKKNSNCKNVTINLNV